MYTTQAHTSPACDYETPYLIPDTPLSINSNNKDCVFVWHCSPLSDDQSMHEVEIKISSNLKVYVCRGIEKAPYKKRGG